MNSHLKLTIEQEEEEISLVLYVDGERFGDETIDPEALLYSSHHSGAFDIQTCGCGEPGCAGIFEPIFVWHDTETVTWEFDSQYHPVASKDGERDSVLVRLVFDRMQYREAVRDCIDQVLRHPKRENIGPFMTDTEALRIEPTVFAEPGLPFPVGTEVVVGYTDSYRQPWIWATGDDFRIKRPVLAKYSLWQLFGYWSAMFDCDPSLGECLMRNGDQFQLIEGATREVANATVLRLVDEIKKVWNGNLLVNYMLLGDRNEPTLVRLEHSE